MHNTLDTFKAKGLRKKMIEDLRKLELYSEKVLTALEAVPRHLYMENAFFEYAYQDRAFSIGAGQTISHPSTVAYQTDLLDLKKGMKVLEIGTGSGYQTSVLLEMGVKVYSIERQKELFDRTKPLLTSLGYGSAKLFFGDGYKGLPQFAPFDRILITAAAPKIPDDLMSQLAIGGILIAPVSNGDVTEMTKLEKKNITTYHRATYGEFKFVPLLEEKAWKRLAVNK